MEWVSFVAPLLGGGVGTALLIVLILVLGSPAVLSEKTAREKFSALPAAERWWWGRKEARDAKEREVRALEIDELRDYIGRVDKKRKEDVDRLQKQIHLLSESEASQHEYIVWVTEGARVVEIWSAAVGEELPWKFMTYPEWRASRPGSTVVLEMSDEVPPKRDPPPDDDDGP